ncbi:MAG TPA: hypothetical protein VLB84_15895, partial [Bacteroidia bacterium]|nr:hypothetical protein [Bacteroidia bacterium]
PTTPTHLRGKSHGQAGSAVRIAQRGGKSLHISACMKNTGKLISMDVEERKLGELKKRAERAGIVNIQTQTINETVIKKHEKSADRLLLDVPCSGLGVLKRNPDAKWKPRCKMETLT